MSEPDINILLVEDDKYDRLAIERHFRKLNLPYNLVSVTSNKQALATIAEEPIDLVLLDYLLGDGTGMDLLPQLNGIPAIIITGAGSEQIAISAIRAGAYDYLIKDNEGNFLTVLPLTIENVLERRHSENALRDSEARYRAFSEFANSVLHNVSNVLNSVGASCELVLRKLSNSKLDRIDQLHLLLKQHKGETFLAKHPKGVQITPFVKALGKKLKEERNFSLIELETVLKNLQLIREIVETQQTQEITSTLVSCNLAKVVGDALKVSDVQLARNQIEVETHFEHNITLRTHKATLTHILINLIKNAIDAMGGTQTETPHLFISSKREGKDGVLTLRDNGQGIEPENIENLFKHGFTTKKAGHGFGLYYCAKAMSEIGGTINVSSQGNGKGSTVILRFNNTVNS